MKTLPMIFAGVLMASSAVVMAQSGSGDSEIYTTGERTNTQSQSSSERGMRDARDESNMNGTTNSGPNRNGTTGSGRSGTGTDRGTGGTGTGTGTGTDRDTGTGTTGSDSGTTRSGGTPGVGSGTGTERDEGR